jgi:uncharacterized protein
MPYRLKRAFIVRAALSIAGLLSLSAHAASFDCTAAHSAIEHAICNDAQLSALDAELAVAYRIALKGQGDSADQLKAEQRQWLRMRTSGGTIDVDALKRAYQARIAELNAMPVLPRSNSVSNASGVRCQHHDADMESNDECILSQATLEQAYAYLRRTDKDGQRYLEPTMPKQDVRRNFPKPEDSLVVDYHWTGQERLGIELAFGGGTTTFTLLKRGGDVILTKLESAD